MSDGPRPVPDRGLAALPLAARSVPGATEPAPGENLTSEESVGRLLKGDGVGLRCDRRPTLLDRRAASERVGLPSGGGKPLLRRPGRRRSSAPWSAGGIYFGTSSWKYEGWLGSIYREDRYKTRGKFSRKKFEESCLAEYAETFPTVCGDFAFYQCPSEQYWAKLFEAVPGDFLFGFKVPEDITVATWPKHARYGPRAGERNPHFLDARAFDRLFARRLEPYRDRLGPQIFEFGTFNKSTFPTSADFYARLDPFLEALPEGFRYSVEIRNPEYLSPDYFGLLSDRNVTHVFNAWTRMPALDEQAQLGDAYTADFAVVRALLRRGRAYEQAVKAFEPYKLIQEPNEGAQEGMAEIAKKARKKKIPAFLFVNNRLEGSAPGTIESVVEGIAV